ncbi:TIGR04282 family arsenosugar biosynthesis glycosyltransferase [Variovorax sp. PAMC 28711]|uniref:TIGR04282 family arsenosugar biosynthesis glycosyltransferase n=1 Tax=Variovorax sp. PAMC 28711 TaxID=1795631 RepID=UPI00078B8B7B|nr:TIGR04282 family arsenosugar biosynthesis glycosyltransferase [Variovorax sp. PAMC 28711]AMM26332.1 hypothetical protein AX767_19720 [Variovorax sp. PAMC 28711]
MASPVRIAILAKAPVAGHAKTRLIPALGAQGAARLQRSFTRDAVRVAREAALGEVVLWCAPDARHRYFRALQRTTGIRCSDQPEGDLGARMLRAAMPTPGAEETQPVLIIGTDCPALGPHHLRAAAEALQEVDAVFIPAEDGGYVLVGLQRPQPGLFTEMTWSTDRVMAETRQRAASLALTIRELPTLWDVDTPADLRRLQALKLSTSTTGQPTHD